MEAVRTRKELAPGPKGWDLYKWGQKIQRSPLATYEDMQKTFGDAVYCPWVNKVCLFVWHPDFVGHVLKENHTNYHKTEQYTELKPLLGNGLLTSNGELWRNQRRLMAKQFHSASIDGYISSIHSMIERTISGLAPGIQNVDAIFSSLTMQIAGEIFFGANVETFVSTIGAGIAFETEVVNRRIRAPFNIPLPIPTPENLKRRKLIKDMNGVVERIMQEDQKGKPQNILSKLMAAAETTPELMKNEVMTLLLAGHETTSNNLMWTCWLLAKHPEWQEAILEELKGSGKKATDLTRADLTELKILRSVLNESLRLMPPVPVFARNNIEADEIGGFFVPKDTTVVCQPWVTHRDERFWSDPLKFSPERFFHRPERKDDYAFFPFARGARSCIGEEMAMVEASFILAAMVEKFTWGLKPGFEAQPVHHLTLQSKNGMWLDMRSR